MGIFLGDKPVSVYFNGTNASVPVQGVFLGGIQVFPTGTAAAILYFYYDPDDEEADNAWTEVGNWWLDASHTQPAGRLPTSADSVVASASITASGQTVVDFTIDGGGDYWELSGSLTVTGIATFIVAGLIGTLNGNATFIDGGTAGTVNGDATFNNSVNQGLVTGTATFNGGACNDDGFGTAGTFVPDPPPSCG